MTQGVCLAAGVRGAGSTAEKAVAAGAAAVSAAGAAAGASLATLVSPVFSMQGVRCADLAGCCQRRKGQPGLLHAGRQVLAKSSFARLGRDVQDMRA